MVIVEDPLSINLEEIQSRLECLTDRQKQVVDMLAHGKTTKQIASLLSIRDDTVKSLVNKSCARTGTQDRIALLVLYSVWIGARNYPCTSA